jgi:GTPase SAR1 family protein
MKNWVEELQANGPSDIILCVIGNKIDKCEDEEVAYSEAKEYAQKVNGFIKVVSAKENKNINVNPLHSLGSV